jgi:phage baseplate assembly protein W
MATVLADADDFLAPPDFRITRVVWLDVNTGLAQNGRSDLLPNIRALVNSLFNLFQCPIGARGPIFEPEYGSILYYMLHEPMDLISANKIKAGLIQAVQRWEPRVEILINETHVFPVVSINAFKVHLVFKLIATQEIAREQFLLNRV